MTDQADDFWGDADVIHVYTRAQAIDDGVLVDVTHTAKGNGFKLPTALTMAAWERAVALPEGYTGTQDEIGRLHDVLMLASFAASRGGGNTDRVNFTVSVAGIAKTSHPYRQNVELYLSITPGDEGEPVLTILLRGED